jgi:hypothetical protein
VVVALFMPPLFLLLIGKGSAYSQRDIVKIFPVGKSQQPNTLWKPAVLTGNRS